jgi:hypothetical protein
MIAPGNLNEGDTTLISIFYENQAFRSIAETHCHVLRSTRDEIGKGICHNSRIAQTTTLKLQML